MDLQQAKILSRQALAFYNDNNFDKALELWGSIEKITDDLKELYAQAQYNMGNLLRELERKDEAIKAYINVSREDSGHIYAYAQWNLAIYTKKVEYLENISLGDDLEIYAEAQFKLGRLEEILDSKNNYWQNIPKKSKQHKKETYQINIVKSITELKSNKFKVNFYEIFERVSVVLKSLFVNNKYENLIAHYTNLDVAKLFLKNKEKIEDVVFEPVSKLRLNTINLMNDPEEGILLNKLLCLDPRISTQDSAFIACFTLHHDSLNQFRLYGKENKEEASGLSLVLDKHFFAEEHNTARIHHKELSSTEKQEDSKSEIIGLTAMPLYRCVYFDPTSGLLKVAQREKWSFSREFKLEGKHYWYDQNTL